MAGSGGRVSRRGGTASPGRDPTEVDAGLADGDLGGAMAPDSTGDAEAAPVAGIVSPLHVGGLDLDDLLARAPTQEERSSWEAMSPSLRRRAAVRLALMRRWSGDRGGLTAADAAVIAGVGTKRFYEMAAAWSRSAGLAAVGAYATAPVERSARIDVRVNGALQAVVSKVVDAVPERASVELLRRSLEAAARLHLARAFPDARSLVMPSPNVLRDIVARELHRRSEKGRLGDSVVGDCSATTMLTTDGEPYVLFCLIDRGTRRILGHAFGSLSDSVAAYGRAAGDALAATAVPASRPLAWAERSRQMNLVQGLDADAWHGLEERVARLAGAPQFGPIVNDRRFGSQYRRFVGDRVGRVVFRPSWTIEAPADLKGQRFDGKAAADWVAAEVAGYNAALGGDGAAEPSTVAPPEGLVATLRLMAG